jgi:beta-glucosidase
VDQYHRYGEDIEIMKKMGVQAYRFSISWSRIIPNGVGEINMLGVKYYKDLIAALKEAGIKPVITLYHWDLPQSLEDKGGWRSRETALAFQKYAEVCFEHFGKDVFQWITINEPWCVAYLGHFKGNHAPGHTSLKETILVIHHINLAHGLAVQSYRKMNLNSAIGITWNLILDRNATKSEKDLLAMHYSHAMESRVFTDPVLHGRYPKIITDVFKWEFPIEAGDMEIISLPLDFIGVNYYNEHAVTYDEDNPKKFAVVPHWEAETDMGWPIVPGGLKRLLDWIHIESAGIPLYITENGCAVIDTITEDGRVHDGERINYLLQHLTVCSEAIEAGIPLKGYFAWSLIDNFEWAWGYSKRFGLVYCDVADQKRIMKDSAYFMRDVIAGYI